jgi:fructokinase
MSEHTPHIVGLGNALVDVVAAVEPEVVSRHGLTSGGMHLVGAEAAHALFEEVGPGVRQSGGSVANTIAHLADTPVRGTYIGKVADDDLGDTFCREMVGLDLAAPVAVSHNDDHGTGRCVVLVTPDGERTMSTYLGAAVTLMPSEARVALPEDFDILLIEGYVWDAPQGAEVIETLASAAKAAGARVALTPSDAGCVERNLAAMRGLIDSHVDILVGNHVEICALGGCDSAEAGLDWAMSKVATAAVTEHDKGSWVADARGRYHVAAEAVAEVVDTTGAGDAYASGFLAGLAQGQPVDRAGAMGARLAAGVLGHYGARDGAAARAIALPAA